MNEPITKVKLPSGAIRWRLRVDVGVKPNGRRDQRCSTHPTRKAAQQELARTRHQVAEGRYVGRSRTTVAQYLTEWTAGRRDLRPNTVAMYHNVLLHVTEAYGSKALQQLTKADLDRLVEAMLTSGRRNGHKGTPLSAATVVRMLVVLGKALDDAVRAGHLPRNAARLVQKPRRTAPTTRRWTEQEADAFLRAAERDRLYACWRLSMIGLRRGELLGLRWCDLDLNGRELHVQQARVALNDGTTIICPPKTVRSRRSLPIDLATVAALRALRACQATERLAAGGAYDGSSGLIGLDEIGHPIRPERYSDAFTRLAKRAGLPQIRLHDARHSALSIMVERGVPISTVAAWAGHADGGGLALRTYVHTSTASLAAAGNTLAEALSGG